MKVPLSELHEHSSASSPSARPAPLSADFGQTLAETLDRGAQVKRDTARGVERATLSRGEATAGKRSATRRSLWRAPGAEALPSWPPKTASPQRHGSEMEVGARKKLSQQGCAEGWAAPQVLVDEPALGDVARASLLAATEAVVKDEQTQAQRSAGKQLHTAAPSWQALGMPQAESSLPLAPDSKGARLQSLEVQAAGGTSTPQVATRSDDGAQPRKQPSTQPDTPVLASPLVDSPVFDAPRAATPKVDAPPVGATPASPKSPGSEGAPAPGTPEPTTTLVDSTSARPPQTTDSASMAAAPASLPTLRPTPSAPQMLPVSHPLHPLQSQAQARWTQLQSQGLLPQPGSSAVQAEVSQEGEELVDPGDTGPGLGGGQAAPLEPLSSTQTTPKTVHRTQRAPLELPPEQVRLPEELSLELDEQLSLTLSAHGQRLHVALDGTAEALTPLLDMETELREELKDGGWRLDQYTTEQRQQSSKQERGPQRSESRSSAPQRRGSLQTEQPDATNTPARAALREGQGRHINRLA